MFVCFEAAETGLRTAPIPLFESSFSKTIFFSFLRALSEKFYVKFLKSSFPPKSLEVVREFGFVAELGLFIKLIFGTFSLISDYYLWFKVLLWVNPLLDSGYLVL